MGKSIKLKDETYWDSTGITHNKELLSEILNSSKDGIEISNTQPTDEKVRFWLDTSEDAPNISGDTFPIGAVIEWHFETLPENWLWTDHDYKIADYPELYALCGTKFNASTTPSGYFRTPTKAGLVAVGKDMTTGTSGNLQPHIVTNFIIKARQSAGVVSEVIQKDGTPNDINVYSSSAIKELLKGLLPETVTNDNGTAIKFPDGTMICTGMNTCTVNITKDFGSGVSYGYIVNVGYFAEPFIKPPIISFTHHTISDVWAIQPYASNTVTTTATGGVYPVASSHISNTPIDISWIAIGKWK